MSSRAVRRARVLVTKQAELNIDAEDEEKVDEDDIIIVQNEQKKNLFDLLDDNNEVLNDDEESENQDTHNTPKKSLAPFTTNPNKQNKKNKKKNSKNSVAAKARARAQKGKQAVTGPDTDEDIDKTIAEISVKYQDLKIENEMFESISSVDSSKSNAIQKDKLAPLLSISSRNLDPEVEMRRMFGSRVIKENARGSRSRLQQGTSRHHGRAVENPYIHNSLRKTILVTPQENWPPFKAGGVSMEYLETVDGNMWFTFTHSRDYQEIQLQFLNVLRTHNPEHIAELLRMYPYHIDTALQLSEILKHSGEIAQASELVERVLYAFERRFHSMFNMALGTCRLSYDRVENRPFFIALFRHIQYLTRKGCWRTALEVNKLLLSLNPHTDPFGALLMIDFIAIKAKEYQWLSSLYEGLKEYQYLQQFPNFSYSMALSEYMKEGNDGDHSQSSKMLREAICLFPFVLAGIYERAAISDSRVTDNKYFQPHPSNTDSASEVGIKLLCDLYVERCNAIWKEPDVLSWLRSVGSVVVSSPEKLEEGVEKRKPMFQSGLSLDMYRHIFVSDINHIRVPPHVLSGGQSAHDPLPPITAIESEYDIETVDASTQANTTMNPIDVLTNFLQTLLPWRNRNPQDEGGHRNDVVENNEEGLFNMVVGAIPGLVPNPTNVDEGDAFLQSFRDAIAGLGLFRNNNNNNPNNNDVNDDQEPETGTNNPSSDEHFIRTEEEQSSGDSIEEQYYWSDVYTGGDTRQNQNEDDTDDDDDYSDLDVLD